MRHVIGWRLRRFLQLLAGARQLKAEHMEVGPAACRLSCFIISSWHSKVSECGERRTDLLGTAVNIIEVWSEVSAACKEAPSFADALHKQKLIL